MKMFDTTYLFSLLPTRTHLCTCKNPDGKGYDVPVGNNKRGLQSELTTNFLILLVSWSGLFSLSIIRLIIVIGVIQQLPGPNFTPSRGDKNGHFKHFLTFFTSSRWPLTPLISQWFKMPDNLWKLILRSDCWKQVNCA
jgi:hypothetical protein